MYSCCFVKVFSKFFSKFCIMSYSQIAKELHQDPNPAVHHNRVQDWVASSINMMSMGGWYVPKDHPSCSSVETEITHLNTSKTEKPEENSR